MEWILIVVGVACLDLGKQTDHASCYLDMLGSDGEVHDFVVVGIGGILLGGRFLFVHFLPVKFECQLP